jgi:hypothetical protein
MDRVHFLVGPAAICGERDAAGTREPDKATCEGCKAALAVTNLVKATPAIEPLKAQPAIVPETKVEG